MQQLTVQNLCVNENSVECLYLCNVYGEYYSGSAHLQLKNEFSIGFDEFLIEWSIDSSAYLLALFRINSK